MKPEEFDYTGILNCMRCGFCLPTCPTYVQLGTESASPRGRLALMKAAADGRIGLEEIEEQMSLCLGCRNCETVCPSGVHFGRLLEDAREAVAEVRPPAQWLRFVLYASARKWVLGLLGSLLWLYQAARLSWLARRVAGSSLPAHVADLEHCLPQLPPPWRRRHPRVLSARGSSRLRVGFFTGCVMDVLFWATNQATLHLLAAAGCDVVIVRGQTCCGALHAHAGDKAQARRLARRNIQAFADADLDCVVNNAGGCGAALKEYASWFSGEPEWRERAERFASQQRDVSEVLVELGLPLKPMSERVTMQESCHLAHGQGVRRQPRALMQAVPGLKFVELEEPDRCCGSAGVYNLEHPDVSLRILDRKMEQVAATGATTIVTTNPGCLLQMRLGIQRAELTGRVRAVHLADLLAEALAPPDVRSSSSGTTS